MYFQHTKKVWVYFVLMGSLKKNPLWAKEKLTSNLISHTFSNFMQPFYNSHLQNFISGVTTIFSRVKWECFKFTTLCAHTFDAPISTLLRSRRQRKFEPLFQTLHPCGEAGCAVKNYSAQSLAPVCICTQVGSLFKLKLWRRIARASAERRVSEQAAAGCRWLRLIPCWATQQIQLGHRPSINLLCCPLTPTQRN